MPIGGKTSQFNLFFFTFLGDIIFSLRRYGRSYLFSKRQKNLGAIVFFLFLIKFYLDILFINIFLNLNENVYVNHAPCPLVLISLNSSQ